MGSRLKQDFRYPRISSTHCGKTCGQGPTGGIIRYANRGPHQRGLAIHHCEHGWAGSTVIEATPFSLSPGRLCCSLTRSPPRERSPDIHLPLRPQPIVREGIREPCKRLAAQKMWALGGVYYQGSCGVCTNSRLHTLSSQTTFTALKVRGSQGPLGTLKRTKTQTLRTPPVQTLSTSGAPPGHLRGRRPPLPSEGLPLTPTDARGLSPHLLVQSPDFGWFQILKAHICLIF